ncbi:hypothetical protein AWZ03_005265 [Drosophila navojoa]|uniref:Uncharacterized protein n=1 Tax=Drosophila navojoa TaxID=7232 RepID=A0A484BJT7_DRONA|nr:uncharacterized protein LOC108654210 [Drosophila navojoa]TDG48310.1 hypothetical protein AWZ03_005265 [Drosophila navojoa]
MSAKRMEPDMEEEGASATPPCQKQRAPVKPLRAKKKPTTTPTSLLCELMRLKAQQKYLECNQVKLNANNFLDDNDPETNEANDNDNDDHDGQEAGVAAKDNGNGGKDKKPGSRRPSSGNKVAGLINDIDRLKLEMDEKLRKHHAEKRGQLQEMWHYMNTLKEDVFQPERLSLYTVNVVRERIVALNGQLERLSAQNAKELEMLREEYAKMERENDFVWKDSI